MEKVIVTLRTGAADDEWAERIRGPVAEQLLGLGVPGLTVNVRDAAVREPVAPPWRDLLVALRRMESRGEIRGGRFVAAFIGEQFALPEALDLLRAIRRTGETADAPEGPGPWAALGAAAGPRPQ